MAVVLVVGVGVYAFLRSGQSNQSTTPDEFVNNQIPTLNPSDIGMVVTVRPDKRALKFELKKASDIKHVDYEIRYNHIVDGEQVGEGITGLMNIATDGITKTDYRPFGTCSGNVCRYDEGVSDVLIVLKVEKNDGKIYQVQDPVKL